MYEQTRKCPECKKVMVLIYNVVNQKSRWKCFGCNREIKAIPLTAEQRARKEWEHRNGEKASW